MKKRVLSFLLCMMLVLPLLLTSCGVTEDPTQTTTEEETLYVKPATLNFYIIADKVTPAAKAEMQEAFNTRCRELYKTQVEFVFCTEEEYEAVVTAKMEAALADGGLSAAEKYEAAEVETSRDELNVLIEHYPELYNNQVDILLITSKEMYDRFYEKGYLSDLTDALARENREIAQRVNTNLINGAKVNGKMYAVPNNVLIGKYEYVLINKELAYDTNYLIENSFLTQDSFTGRMVFDYAAALEFAREIADNKAWLMARPEYSGVSNIYPLSTAFAYPTVEYFPLNGERSLFGVVYQYSSTYTNPVEMINVLDHESYRAHFALMLEANTRNYYPSATDVVDENTMYGIVYTTGTYSDVAKWTEDYYVYTVDQPRLVDDAPFEAMFAVSSCTASLSRSMEIIEDLVANTDAELRNILQYGVEGLHYTVDPFTECVERKNSDYIMNANYTGNVITAYPCPEDGRGENFATEFKMQNDTATRNPLYGMSPDLLWGNVKDEMVALKLAEKARAAIKAEITGWASDAPILKPLVSTADKTAKKNELIASIPGGTSISKLRDFWLSIRAGIDPNAVYEEGQEIPEVPKDPTITAALQQMQAQAIDESEAFIAQAAASASAYMEEAYACKTVEEFEALCTKLSGLNGEPNNDVAALFYNDRAKNWSQRATEPFGMLIRLYNSEPCVSSLAGALQNWFNTVVQ